MQSQNLQRYLKWRSKMETPTLNKAEARFFGFGYYQTNMENMAEMHWFDSEGNYLETPARDDHTLTALEKLEALSKKGIEVDAKLLVSLAYAIRERRNRNRMGWVANPACKNTLRAVQLFIENSYEK